MKMKKFFLAFAATVTVLFLAFTGCSSGDTGEGSLYLDYNVLLQMPKSYVSHVERVECESLAQYKEEFFSHPAVQGALVTVECIDTVFYVTVEDVYIAGKAVTRCKITDVGEKFNGYAPEIESVVEVEQDYYIFPAEEKDTAKMLESFGASFSRNFFGKITEMELKEGEYPLKIQEGVEYELKLSEDVLPMESGKQYTGILTPYKENCAIQYLLPLEETDRYDGFRRSPSVLKLAGEIKDSFSK